VGLGLLGRFGSESVTLVATGGKEAGLGLLGRFGHEPLTMAESGGEEAGLGLLGRFGREALTLADDGGVPASVEVSLAPSSLVSGPHALEVYLSLLQSPRSTQYSLSSSASRRFLAVSRFVRGPLYSQWRDAASGEVDLVAGVADGVGHYRLALSIVELAGKSHGCR
jgi:hypothetical protein